MTVALKFWVIGSLLWLLAAAVQADVSHLGNRRYKVERLRLQRLESEPTPYPAAGYRPDREFGLPQNQPIFPFTRQYGSRPSGGSGFNHVGEAQRPQLSYGSNAPEPRLRPQKVNNVDQPQEQVYVIRYHQRQPAAHNFARPQPQPQHQISNAGFEPDFSGYAEEPQYNLQEQTIISSSPEPQNGFNTLPESQQPDLLYGAPNIHPEQKVQSARLRQQLVARLQKAERLEQLLSQKQQQAESQRYKQTQSQILSIQQQRQQQLLNEPQHFYSIPSPQQLQLQAASSHASRFVAQKPARLTDNREETETEIELDAKSAEIEEIETTTMANDKKTVTQTAVTTPVVPEPGVVGYYPAAAVGFVQPLNPAAAAAAAAYYTAANYQTAQPFSAAYTLGAPYLSQPYVVAANPAAQLKAW